MTLGTVGGGCSDGGDVPDAVGDTLGALSDTPGALGGVSAALGDVLGRAVFTLHQITPLSPRRGLAGVPRSRQSSDTQLPAGAIVGEPSWGCDRRMVCPLSAVIGPNGKVNLHQPRHNSEQWTLCALRSSSTGTKLPVRNRQLW